MVYVGSNDANLYALNATTGTQLWSYPTRGMVQSSPAVVNCVVYVGSYAGDNNVYAIGTPCPAIPTTTLNITANATSVAVNQNFTLNGTLSAGTSGIPGATITLERSTDNATWDNVTSTTTSAPGNYQFGTNESTP